MRGAVQPRILVTGGSGQVGWELRRTLAPLGAVTAPSRAEMDLADPAALARAVRALAPDVVVSAAAFTEVDRAETERDLARAVNAVAPGVLAEEAARRGALLVHFSTDYVFDGGKGAPYAEGDAPAPLGVYGATKLAGERAVAEAGGDWLVLRTSWVFGMRGRNFLRTILRLARERDELSVVDDQVGSPTWSRLLAEAVSVLVARHLRGPGIAAEGLAGVYHLSAAGQTSWCGFARAILEADPRRDEHRARGVRAIPTSAYPTPAARPPFSVLDNTRISGTFGVRLPPWHEQLHLALDDR